MSTIKKLAVKLVMGIATCVGALALYRRLRYGSWRKLPETVPLEEPEHVRPPRLTDKDLVPVSQHWHHTLWQIPGQILGDVLDEDARPATERVHDVQFGYRAEDILWATLLTGCAAEQTRQWYMVRVKWFDTSERETVLICVGPEDLQIVTDYQTKAYHLYKPADPGKPEVRNFTLHRLMLLNAESMDSEQVRRLAEYQEQQMVPQQTRSRLPRVPRNLLRGLAGLSPLAPEVRRTPLGTIMGHAAVPVAPPVTTKKPD